jgi:hypothetical protein
MGRVAVEGGMKNSSELISAFTVGVDEGSCESRLSVSMKSVPPRGSCWVRAQCVMPTKEGIQRVDAS